MNRAQMIERILMAMAEIESFTPSETRRERELLDSLSDAELEDRFREVVTAALEVTQG